MTTELDKQARKFFIDKWSEDLTEPMWTGENIINFGVAFASQAREQSIAECCKALCVICATGKSYQREMNSIPVLDEHNDWRHMPLNIGGSVMCDAYELRSLAPNNAQHFTVCWAVNIARAIRDEEWRRDCNELDALTLDEMVAIILAWQPTSGTPTDYRTGGKVDQDFLNSFEQKAFHRVPTRKLCFTKRRGKCRESNNWKKHQRN